MLSSVARGGHARRGVSKITKHTSRPVQSATFPVDNKDLNLPLFNPNFSRNSILEVNSTSNANHSSPKHRK